MFLTVRLTLLSGRNSDAAATNSFPYFVENKFRICSNSGKSEHLGEAKMILATASCNSIGQSLLHFTEYLPIKGVQIDV